MGSLVSLAFLGNDKTSQKLASSEHYRHSISDEEIKFCNIDTNRIELLLFSANISWFLGYIFKFYFVKNHKIANDPSTAEAREK